jgi:CRP-like cAMP-binding protein
MTANSGVRNLLLAGLSEPSYDGLRRRLSPVTLQLRDPIQLPGQKIRFIYFFESAISSIIAKAGPEEVEVGICGRDGMSGTSVLLFSETSPYECFVQVPGDALRVEVEVLRELMTSDLELARRFVLFAEFSTIQIAQTALANARFTVLERMARWILMCHDRITGDEMELTHSFLSTMLGVRRAGVTTDMHVLEGEGAVVNRRGRVLVRDRQRLEEFAGDCYGTPEAEYERLLGVRLRRPGTVAGLQAGSRVD